MATISVSSTSVPSVHPITETRASRSERAEKNFWYITWLPSISSSVGTRNSSALTTPMLAGPRTPPLMR